MAVHRYIGSTEAYQLQVIDSMLDELSKHHPFGKLLKNSKFVENQCNNENSNYPSKAAPVYRNCGGKESEGYLCTI
jgi:hypothetical protein